MLCNNSLLTYGKYNKLIDISLAKHALCISPVNSGHLLHLVAALICYGARCCFDSKEFLLLMSRVRGLLLSSAELRFCPCTRLDSALSLAFCISPCAVIINYQARKQPCTPELCVSKNGHHAKCSVVVSQSDWTCGKDTFIVLFRFMHQLCMLLCEHKQHVRLLDIKNGEKNLFSYIT